MELRDKIIQAALELFGEFGYEKTTIAQIVKRSGSSKGGFYHHFEGKKEILDEITNMYLKEVIDGCNEMINNSKEDTIYLLNNVFATVNNFKKQRLASWKELINVYSHEDSEPIRYNMYVRFLAVTTEIYEGLILKAIEEGFINPSSPKALASMWTHEVTRLYGLITEVIVSGAQTEKYDDFLAQAQFVEDTINNALNADKKLIYVLKPLKEYLDMAIKTVDMSQVKQQ